jgi:hypothetical protein
MYNNYYYLDTKEEVQGPLALSDLDLLYKSGVLTAATLVCAEGTQNWIPFFQLPRPAPEQQEPKKVDLPTPIKSALISCPACGKSVSQRAPACPNCGEPINVSIANPSQEAPVGAITSGERGKLWVKFWLSAVGAIVVNILLIILFQSGLVSLPPLVALGIAAVPPFLIWASLAKRLEKYKAHTGISYPSTYVVLAILSLIGLIGPLLMLISFSIRLGKIPVIQSLK